MIAHVACRLKTRKLSIYPCDSHRQAQNDWATMMQQSSLTGPKDEVYFLLAGRRLRCRVMNLSFTLLLDILSQAL